MSTEGRSGLLLIHSHFGEPPALYREAAERGVARIVRERDLSRADFDGAQGLITNMHLDQIGFLAWSEAAQALLDSGGRWFFNGHFLRELVPGLGTYVPIRNARRDDLVLTRLSPHPLFEGTDVKDFEENKGVAGFYGRGHTPMPAGAVAVTGLGKEKVPVDWEWVLPGGGRLFSHAGNDIGGMGGTSHTVVGPRIIDWTLGELGR